MYARVHPSSPDSRLQTTIFLQGNDTPEYLPPRALPMCQLAPNLLAYTNTTCDLPTKWQDLETTCRYPVPLQNCTSSYIKLHWDPTYSDFKLDFRLHLGDHFSVNTYIVWRAAGRVVNCSCTWHQILSFEISREGFWGLQLKGLYCQTRTPSKKVQLWYAVKSGFLVMFKRFLTSTLNVHHKSAKLWHAFRWLLSYYV